MKYLYFFSWMLLAAIHIRVARAIFYFNNLVFTIRKTSDVEQQRWKSDYNQGFVGFPGGMIDWAAFGLTLTVVYAVTTLPLFYFELGHFVLESKFRLSCLWLPLTLLVYYRIYFANICWLTRRINNVSAKYYL